MRIRVARSKRVEVKPGEKAIAPRVDDPRGFAVENRSGRPVTASFSYDAKTHVQTVVLEEHRPDRHPGDVHPTGELPV
jgi:hypothetical protein